MLRRAVERDRYGLMAYVLVARDHCTPSDCAAFRSLTDRRQIVANMDERTYDGLISRYAPSWNAPAPTAAPAPVAALAPSMPTGKPTNADFPSAASTPPVNIMTPEPGTAPAASRRRARPAAAGECAAAVTAPAGFGQRAGARSSRPAAAKKQPAPKHRPAAPVQLAPAAPPLRRRPAENE